VAPRRAIQRHLPPEQLVVLKAAKESERVILRNIIGRPNGDTA
jgi:hypothetical protein